ncbi:MAG: hypothetical protein DF168_01487 [Candidatus Moanabacter tarae]|uniref:Uncharacterized protein n=1 Tax=Candidatus Moanibacter tarae TaxID=2200854 RepID=A0A2Z4ADW0_9BACT|nr:MAG: hypothetical protein DF168_01487 [Candidatus Moanabacter tarae]|tara:strand:- start:24722 stop:24934 length:213 start_codon:yes stop_codon:yes gene_type:complete
MEVKAKLGRLSVLNFGLANRGKIIWRLDREYMQVSYPKHYILCRLNLSISVYYRKDQVQKIGFERIFFWG